MRLNTEKIKHELSRTGKNYAEFAREIGVSRQLFHYWIKHPYGVPLYRVELIGRAMQIDPKDLITHN
jgi:hypothetical protein